MLRMLTLKEEPVRTKEPVSTEAVDDLKKTLQVMFPKLDISKVQKAHTKKSLTYNNWLDLHARERNYTFQLRKCDNIECCSPARLPRERLTWLPDPVLDENGQHYKDYQEVKSEETTEADRPSLSQKVQKKRKQELLTTVARKKLAETKGSNNQPAETETEMSIQMSPRVQMRSPSQKQRNPLRTIMLPCQTCPMLILACTQHRMQDTLHVV